MVHVLVVDDEADNRLLYTRILEFSGYTVTLARDGAEGVQLARSARPDVILMDMAMPVMDGWHATAQLKADPALARIPVIALTAHAMIADRVRALEAGCNAYLAKPVDRKMLLSMIERQVTPTMVI